MTSAFTMVTCYGRVDIRLARPFSVRDFVLNKLGMEVSGPLGVVNGRHAQEQTMKAFIHLLCLHCVFMC